MFHGRDLPNHSTLMEAFDKIKMAVWRGLLRLSAFIKLLSDEPAKPRRGLVTSQIKDLLAHKIALRCWDVAAQAIESRSHRFDVHRPRKRQHTLPLPNEPSRPVTKNDTLFDTATRRSSAFTVQPRSDMIPISAGRSPALRQATCPASLLTRATTR